MPVPQGQITTTDTTNNIVLEPYEVLDAVLLDQWGETLPNESGHMASKILEGLTKQGWKLVKNE